MKGDLGETDEEAWWRPEGGVTGANVHAAGQKREDQLSGAGRALHWLFLHAACEVPYELTLASGQ